jgi:hypothetical protein
MAFATRLTKVRQRSEHFDERTWMCSHQVPLSERVVGHVRTAGKQSLTWNTTLYLFLEPVMQPLDEN